METNKIAAGGLKKLFIAGLLSVLMLVFGLLSLAIALMALKTTGVGNGFTIIIGLVEIGAAIAAFVLQLVGLSRLSKIHPAFNVAFILFLVGIVGAFIKVFIIMAINGAVPLVLDIIFQVVAAAVIYFVFRGGRALLCDAGRTDTAAFGRLACIIYMACAAIEVIGSLLSGGLGYNGALAVSVITGLAGIAALAFYLVFLYRASSELAYIADQQAQELERDEEEALDGEIWEEGEWEIGAQEGKGEDGAEEEP